MKKVVAAISILFLSAVVHAQQEIKIDELAKYVGDSITVCTKIYGGIFLDRSKDTPTLLNAGGKYPDAPLTVVIWADARAKFEEKRKYFIKTRMCALAAKSVCIKISRR